MRSVHTNPAEAVQIHQDVRSRFSIACHWGTFRLTDEPLNEPPVLLYQALKKQGIEPADFRAVQPGQTLKVQTVAFVYTPKGA
jgi:N-acyl-phosphatidylethanolamine-hydrolysing phospholipase D